MARNQDGDTGGAAKSATLTLAGGILGATVALATDLGEHVVPPLGTYLQAHATLALERVTSEQQGREIRAASEARQVEVHEAYMSGRRVSAPASDPGD